MTSGLALGAEVPDAEARPRSTFGAVVSWVERPIPSLVAIAFATRVAFVAVAALAGSYLPQDIDGWNRGPAFIRYFARWDSGFYMDIAQFGYGFKPEAWSFNPGYSIVVSAVWRGVPGIDLPTAGFLVSNVAFLASIIVLYALASRWFDERTAWRASVLVAVMPGSFYLSAVYADAFFLLILVSTFLAIDRGRLVLAGALAAVAGITRPPGILLVLTVGAVVLADAWRVRRLRASHVGAGLSAISLPLLFFAYSWWATGDAFISARSREVYWPNVGWHWPTNIFLLDGVPDPIRLLIVAGILFVAACMAYSVRDMIRTRDARRFPLHAWCLAVGVVYVAYAEPNPVVRYLATFPTAYLFLAELGRSKIVFAAILAVCGMVAAAVAVVFATWGPLY